MATRSTIAMQQPDGHIMKIYCHWDGYLDHNGQILRDHYTDKAKLFSLMLLGDLSTLRPEIGQPHSFDNPNNEQWCVAYGRDRKGPGSHCRVYRDFAHYTEECQMEEYNYLWRDGQWYVEFRGCEGGYLPLAEAMEIEAELRAD